MSRKKRAKTQRRSQQTSRVRLPKALSRAMGFFRRHSIAAIISGTFALLASLATIYGLSEPKIVAIPPSNTFNGSVTAEPGSGLTIWVEGEQRFKNASWRGGGHIAGLQMVPKSAEAAKWMTNKTVNSISETFGVREEKVVKFNGLFQFPELTPGKQYPQFVVDIQFLNEKGAVVTEYESGKPYALTLNISDLVLNSLKTLSGPGR